MPSIQVGQNADLALAYDSNEFTITASKSTTTVTKTAGRDFTVGDIGTFITWAAPASTTDIITGFTSATVVTVAASATIASQSATVGILTSMGFILARDNKGVPQWRCYDDAPRLLVAQVQEAGFKIDPTTLEMTFEKSAWDGPFGAYTERQGSNRPAYGINVSFNRKNPILAPKRYTAAGVRIPTTSTASMVFDAAAKTIAYTGIGSEILAGDKITITGGTGNNTGQKTVTVSAANLLTVSEALDNETASVSLQMDFEGAIVGATEFGSNHYICDNQKVYVMVSPALAWTTTPGTAYFKTVFDYNNDAVTLERLSVHNGYIYLTAGTAAYAYSATGAAASWTKSNKASDASGAYAHLFLTGPKGILHKVTKPNSHYSMSVATDEAIDGGTAWSGPDSIGDTSRNVVEMLLLQNSVVFCREDGVFTMDSAGNLENAFPELTKFLYTSNGMHSEVWNSNSLFYLMAQADMYMLQAGRRVLVTPSAQIERAMEKIASEVNTFTGRVYGVTGIPQYLFAVMQVSGTARVLILEDVPGQGIYWRTFVDYTSGNNGVIWTTAISTQATAATTGPVLWAQMGDPYKPSYWILPQAGGALADSRSKYETPGYIYEPWLDFGCPDTDKLWSSVDVICKGTSATLAALALAGYNASGTSILSKTPTIGTAPTYSDNAFTADSGGNYITKRCRLLWTLSNTDAGYTPELLFYRVRARALPKPKRVFDFSVDIPASANTHGLATQEQARAFLNSIRTARRPLTLTDVYGASYTVIPEIQHPQEVVGTKDHVKFGEVFSLRLIEQVNGI